MGKAKKEKRSLDILSDGAGKGLSKIQINEGYVRRLDHNKRLTAQQRDEDRRKLGLAPASASASDDEESTLSDDEDDAIASHRVDRRVFEVIRNGDPRVLDEDANVYSSSSEDETSGEEQETMKQLAPYRECEWKVTHHKKLSKDLILGVQKKEGKKQKSSKKSRSDEDGPSSSEPNKDKPMNEQEETVVRRKSTRSGRRKRRNPDLKMSTKRRLAYGLINSKRPKSH